MPPPRPRQQQPQQQSVDLLNMNARPAQQQQQPMPYQGAPQVQAGTGAYPGNAEKYWCRVMARYFQASSRAMLTQATMVSSQGMPSHPWGVCRCHSNNTNPISSNNNSSKLRRPIHSQATHSRTVTPLRRIKALEECSNFEVSEVCWESPVNLLLTLYIATSRLLSAACSTCTVIAEVWHSHQISFLNAALLIGLQYTTRQTCNFLSSTESSHFGDALHRGTTPGAGNHHLVVTSWTLHSVFAQHSGNISFERCSEHGS